MFLNPLRSAILCASCCVSVSGAGAAHAAVVDRTEYSTTTQAAGGELKTNFGLVPLNYQDASGDWRPVDTSLEPAGSGTVAAAALDGAVEIPASAGGRVSVEHDGREVSIKLVGASGGGRTVTDSTAEFTGVLPGVTASYTATANGVKEVVTLGSAADRLLEYDLRGPGGWTASAASGDIVLKDTAGNVQFRVAAPIAWDSAEDPAFTNDLELAVSEVSSGRWTVTLTPDQAWIDDPARTWPVSIDPDVTWEDGTTRVQGAADCYLASNTQANYNFCDLGYMHTGTYNRFYKTLVRFDLSSIPSNATVSSSKFKAFHPPTGPHLVAQHKLRTITSSWDPATVTWNKRNATTSWTTGGGDVTATPSLISAATGVQNTAWYEWTAPTAAVQGWVDGTIANNGFQLSTESGSPSTTAYTFISNEATNSGSYPATSAERPILEVTWEEPDAPTLDVSGDFVDAAAAPIDGSIELAADIEASSPVSEIESVAVTVGEIVMDRIESDQCEPDCSDVEGELALVMQELEPGAHVAEFVATDTEGRTADEQVAFTIEAPVPFSDLVDDWADDADDAIDGMPSGAPAGNLPAPPDAITQVGACEDEPNEPACRRDAADWAAEVQAWLETSSQPAAIPDLPDFPVPADGLDASAANASSAAAGMLQLAMNVARAPSDPQSVGITFDAKTDEADVLALTDDSTVVGETAIIGAPGPGDWRYAEEYDTEQSVEDVLDTYYANAAADAEDNIEELADEAAADPGDVPLAEALSDAEDFADELDNKGPVIGGLTTTLTAAAAATALEDSADISSGITVAAPLENEAVGRFEAQPPATTAAVAARGSNVVPNSCADHEEYGVLPSKVQGGVNPIYYAPANHKADTLRLTNNEKWNRLRVRWTASQSLAWFCSGRSGSRAVEIEARVPYVTNRFSTNWPRNRAYSTNLPGARKNERGGLWWDDLAIGTGYHPTNIDPTPDFAIVFNAGRDLVYDRLYKIGFKTNTGDSGTDNDHRNRVVSYTVQANSWFNSNLLTAAGVLESGYCALRSSGRVAAVPSCYFRRSMVCVSRARVVQGPLRTSFDWRRAYGAAGKKVANNDNWEGTHLCNSEGAVRASLEGDEAGGPMPTEPPSLASTCWVSLICSVNPGQWPAGTELWFWDEVCQSTSECETQVGPGTSTPGVGVRFDSCGVATWEATVRARFPAGSGLTGETVIPLQAIKGSVCPS